MRYSDRASTAPIDVARAARRECHIDMITRGAAGERRKLIACELGAGFRGAVPV